jgi:hypothetical protein
VSPTLAPGKWSVIPLGTSPENLQIGADTSGVGIRCSSNLRCPARSLVELREGLRNVGVQTIRGGSVSRIRWSGQENFAAVSICAECVAFPLHTAWSVQRGDLFSSGILSQGAPTEGRTRVFTSETRIPPCRLSRISARALPKAIQSVRGLSSSDVLDRFSLGRSSPRFWA